MRIVNSIYYRLLLTILQSSDQLHFLVQTLTYLVYICVWPFNQVIYLKMGRKLLLLQAEQIQKRTTNYLYSNDKSIILSEKSWPERINNPIMAIWLLAMFTFQQDNIAGTQRDNRR